MMPLTCLIIETVFRTNERIFEKPHTCISSIVLLMICKYAWSCPSPSHHHSSLIPNSVAAQSSLFLSDKFVLLCVYFIEVTVYRVTLPRTQYTCHGGCQGGEGVPGPAGHVHWRARASHLTLRLLSFNGV